MTNATKSAVDLNTPLPSPATHSGNSDSDWSPLASVLSLIALVGIPTLIYAFFFAIKCPRGFRRQSNQRSGEPTREAAIKNRYVDAVTTVKYMKEENGKDKDSECPVCLTAFVDGEEVKQLNACSHAFHVACIDMWLCSHSSCPVCRATIGVKRPRRPAVDRVGEDDFRQGLPDSANLV